MKIKSIRKMCTGLLILLAGVSSATAATESTIPPRANIPFIFGEDSGPTPIVFHGWGKIRLENVSASEDRVADLFGNETEETTKLDHRFFLEGSTHISEHFQAGAMLRFSSEPDEVLLDGPVYLENEMGSVFASFSNPWLDARLGYYEIAFTPLTLMRFDPKDLPENGGDIGDIGCGCASGGGTSGTRLLEDIQEKLTFEGGRVNMLFGDHVETTVLYARSSAPVEDESYRRHTIGARALFRYYLPHASEDLEASVQFVYHDDEEESISSAPDDSPQDNRVASVYVKAPVVRNARFFGEAAWSRLEVEPLADRLITDDPSEGNGYTAGLALDFPGRVSVEGAYVYREEDFASLLGALTYLGNQHGGRINLSWTSPEDFVSVDMFGRYIEEVKAATPGDPATFVTSGAGVTVIPIPDLSVRLSGIMEEQKKDATEVVNDVDARVGYGILKAVYQVFKDNDIEVKYQYANYDDRENRFDDYETHTMTTEMRIRF